ncbi:MAG TPA: TIGR01777 family oxidoreductase [Verrucomicrobiae bacterium]|nr:TIGR01777 family oxidoreductase [Verrucomicrobiae bacterium]
MNNKRIVLAGGSGFIGRSLVKELLARNYDMTVLTRSPRPRSDGVNEVQWDGMNSGAWISCLDGAEAVINLTGRSIQCRFTPENVFGLTASRVEPTLAIAAAIGTLTQPPRVWVQASAIGFYGDQKDRLCDETSPSGADTLAGICQQWEAAFNSASTPKTRRALLRIGFVLGRDGGALPVLARITKWFLGGTVGSGEQFISWIHIQDLCRMFIESVEREELAGTFNAVGPNAVTNREFMRELRRTLRRPWSPPAPEWAVKLGSRLMGAEPSLALAGCRVAPRRFLEAGFQLEFGELCPALKNILR